MELRSLISETILYIKEGLNLLKQDLPEPFKTEYNNFFTFIDEKLFEGNPKATASYETFRSDPNNDTFKAKLEVRLEVSLEDEKDLQINLEHLLHRLKMIKEKNAELQMRITGLLSELTGIKDDFPDIAEKLETGIEALMQIKKQSQVVSPEPVQKQEIQTEEEIPVTSEDDLNAELIEIENQFQIDEEHDRSRESIIIVPWDFSQVAEYALQHANIFAKLLHAEVVLLHIVKKHKDGVGQIPRLNSVADENKTKTGVSTKGLIREGSIFSTISTVAAELNARMLVMGTHGIKGMQKLTGSWALKVIADTKAPFLVVQDQPRNTELKDVVFPVDHTRETRQKLGQAKFLARYFKDIKFHICKPSVITTREVLKRFNNNLNFMRSYFVQNEINFEINVMEGAKSSADATIKYIEENHPDLILIAITKDIGIQDYILGADEQKIIVNSERIPVLCINPTSSGRYSYSTGTSG